MEEKSYRQQYDEWIHQEVLMPENYIKEKFFGSKDIKLTDSEIRFLIRLLKESIESMCDNYTKFGSSYTDKYADGFDEEVSFRKMLCLKLNYMR